jgi:hypothetical protein
VAGSRGQWAGEGVWRSDDGGESWAPRWEGLEHLRVERIELSPRFAQDATLLAYSPYFDVEALESGYSIHRSDDGGLQWTRVITAESSDLLPSPSAYLPITATAELPVRKASWSEPLEVRIEDGTWVTVTAAFAAQEALRALLAAPQAEGAPGSADIFVVTDKGVYRSPDGGRAWQAWADARLEGRTYENEIRAAAVTPRLSDGSYRLLVGTAAGELWQLDPATLAWADITPPEAAAPAAPVTATVAATPIPTSVPTPTTAAITPTTTVTPTATPVVTATATPMPATAAPVGSATPLPETPPEGLFVPEGVLALRWLNDPQIQRALGYAKTETPATIPGAYQFFEHGTMLWRGDTQQIYVAFQDGTWAAYDDTFREGEPERDPNLFTPGELLQPIRGFGKLWRTTPGLRDRVGWARAEEEGANAEVLEFERGILFRIEGLTYALFTTPEGQRWLP